MTIKVISGTFERVNEAIFYPTELADELNVGRFEGRTELIRQIDRFIDERKRGYLVVVGAAGVGKSALAARLVWQRKCAFHFTGQGGGSRIPEQARKSLAAQLIGAWQLSEEFTPHDTFPKSAEKAAWLGDVLRAAAGARDKIHPDKRPPIVLVIDALDEAGPDAPGMDTGVPLGLPAPRRLPDGVFIVATSRFGAPLGDLDRSDRLILDIRSATNRQDMASYLHRLLDGGPDTDDDLVDVLGQHHMSTEGFVDSLLRACDGGWMYLTYVLDDIREKRLSPAEVSGLPGGLRAHYMQQVTRWENNDEALWRGVRRPTLALLAALRRRATAAELADWAKADAEDVANWLDQDLRAFLKVTKPRPMPHTYRIRHQSLRDLFVPQPGPAPDTDVDDCLENEDTTHDDRSSERLHRALIDAHRRLTTYFVPPGDPGERTWSGIDEYARCNLPEHAAACGRLDDLVADVGFLLTCDPAGILCYRSSLRTPAGVAAVNAYEAALHEPTAHPDDPPGWWIHVWAKKTGAGALADSAIRHVQRRRMWTVQTAIWAGATHRTIA
ncbi:ATP-binding protein, partial [Frankia sp. CiP3]|uniref:ATP-binding protein n=1 Tax=Frankia sp. CiP3 TaxID=2880971 RepID=UPI001EF75000